MALKRMLGAALVVSVLGLAGCSQPVKKDPVAGATSTPASTPATAQTPVAVETPTDTGATPAATGTPVAHTDTGGELEDYELAEGLPGYEEVLALADSIPPSSPEVVARGKELYAANCALCHGATGLGDGDGGASLDPPPRDLTATSEYKYGHKDLALFRTSMYGVEGTGMAPWEGIIDADDQWAIGHYIRTIQK